MNRRIPLIFLFAIMQPVGVFAADAPPAGAWVKLYEQTPDDTMRFRRQAHGGSCFDSQRGQLILFGSDTHGRDWTNSPLMFDVATQRWSRVYPNDDRSTYRVNREGIPVAGEHGDHPWAMHTFGAVMYDPARDEMIVACAPKHMVPGRFTDSMKDLWPRIKRHPTWTFNLKTSRWRALPCEGVDFFPHSAAFDTDRNVVLGFRPDGIYELSGSPRAWKRLTKKGFLGGWHSNCVYDSKNKSLVVFGANTNRNDVEVYDRATGEQRIMPTPGIRPPKDQHNPMAFHRGIAKTIVLVDHNIDGKPAVTETWLYDLAEDSWSQVAGATLPFACGMNYNLEYDPHRRRVLLVTGGYRQPTVVWALRIGKQR